MRDERAREREIAARARIVAALRRSAPAAVSIAKAKAGMMEKNASAGGVHARA
jgi:hypothetical protein